MEFLYEYGLFLAKAVTWVAAILVVVTGVVGLVRQVRQHATDHLEVKSLNDRFRDLGDALKHSLLSGDELKRERKARKAADKARAKALKKGTAPVRQRVYVLDFHGDIGATAVSSLREEISAILQVARDGDEVLVRLESEGGVVHGYGLAASQLRRLREHKVRLTVAVDKVAASGGYLMACVADRIVAAPFAILGSIGVVAQLPNFNRLLKKHDVDFELHTAGEYKRTLTVFGENTAEARQKFQEMLDDAHALFKSFLVENRPQVSLAEVATGEHWFGTRAISLKLVDELKTSDDWLLERSKDADLHELRFKRHRGLAERLAGGIARLKAATFFP
ncbi:MAG TPA: protease SohB [Candidatus Binatia bacterium]|nr:protease SohB [Candidatus Binatia bacterium]